MHITSLTALTAELRPHAQRLLCRCRALATLDTRTVKALLPVTVAVWLATRYVTDGFAFHLFGLLIIVLAALRMRKERALLTALVVVMVDSEGVLYRPAAAPSFVVRSLFFFVTVFVADYLRATAAGLTCPVAAAGDTPAPAPPLPDAPQVKPEVTSLLDASRWEHRSTIDEVAATFIRLCRETVNFHSLVYLAYHPQSGTLAGEVRISHGTALAEQIRIPLGAGLVGRLVQQGERRYLSSFAQDWTVLQYYGSPEKVRSVLVIPVQQGGELHGALVLDSKSANAFALAQLETLTLLAQAFDQLWHLASSEFDYQEHIRKYHLLLSTQQQLLEHAHDLRKVERYVCDLCRDLLQADTCTLHWAGAPRADILVSDRARYLLNAVDWVTRHRQTLRVGSAPAETTLLSGVRRETLRQGFQSLVAAPVLAGSEIIAVIAAEGRLSNRFTPVDEEALRILATQIAAVIHTARQQDTAQRERAQARELLAAQADLGGGADGRETQQGICAAFARLFPSAYVLFYRVRAGAPQPLCGRDWEGDLPRNLLRCRALREAVLTKRLLFIDDTALPGSEVVQRSNVRSLLLVPLTGSDGTVTGLVELGSRKVAGFAAADLALLDTVRTAAARTWAAAEAQHQLQAELRTDPVTGCGNRRCLDDFLAAAARQGADGTWAGCAALLIDLLSLPELQRRYGTTETERLQKRVAQVLAECGGSDAQLVRRRDGEFVLLLPGADAPQALARVEEVQDRLRQQVFYCRGDKLPQLPVAVGAAAAGTAVGGTRVLEQAELALLRARDSADRRCVFAG